LRNLLKIIAGELKPIAGTVQFGHEVRMGYYAQVHEELRKLGEPLHEHLHQLHHQKAVKDVRGSLGLMLFEGDEQKKKLSALSGGEMARYVFADLMLQKPNFLVLDEPTNHLDIEGIEALEDALVAYQGTVLTVSHDRAFIKKVCNRVFELKDGALRELDAEASAETAPPPETRVMYTDTSPADQPTRLYPSHPAMATVPDSLPSAERVNTATRPVTPLAFVTD
jgi:ATPase subunit of ABC transporter with duplicated ATPase domains